MFRLTFFFTKKKKGYKKEVGERAARPLSIRLCAFCADELVKIETQAQQSSYTPILANSPLFLQIYLGYFDLTFFVNGLAHQALTKRLDGKIRLVDHAPRALPLIRIKNLLFFIGDGEGAEFTRRMR